MRCRMLQVWVVLRENELVTNNIIIITKIIRE